MDQMFEIKSNTKRLEEKLDIIASGLEVLIKTKHIHLKAIVLL